MTKLVHPEDWKPKGVSEFEENAEWAIKSRENSLISAGPGSGKTELLAQRAAYLLETGICRYPRKILAISFKNDAARNLRERVRQRIDEKLCRRFDSLTFDSFAKSLLDRFQGGVPPVFRPSENYTVEPALDSKNNLSDWFLNLQGMHPELTRASIATLGKSFYEKWVIGRQLNANGFGEDNFERIAAGAMWEYQLKRNPSVLNFPMIGRLAELILRANPKIVSALRHTYAFVFLDEFQDTTQIQYDLTRTAFLGSKAILTAVGDGKQRIMLWAGALSGVFQEFQSDFRATPKSLLLNWRSAPELIRIQHYLILAMDEKADLPRVPYRNKDKQGVCKLLVFRDEQHEAQHLAQIIADYIHKDKIAPRDIGILARQKIDEFTQELRSELSKKGVKVRVETVYQDLLAEPIIELLLMIIEVATVRRCPEVWTKLSKTLFDLNEVEDDSLEERRLQRKTKEFCTALAKRLKSDLSEEELKKELSEIVVFIGLSVVRNRYKQYQKGKWLRDVVFKFAKLICICRKESGGWAEAVADFRGENSVPILTIHKSKGLEYEAVVFLGLEDSALWGYQKNAAEEDCSFFVAFSRAKAKILFTFAKNRLQKSQSRSVIEPLYERMINAGIKLENVP